MGFAIDAIQNLMFEIVPISNVLPKTLWNGFSVIHGMHRTWRLYRQAEKYTDSSNLFTIFADQGIGVIIRSNNALQFGAQCLMVLRCISDCADGYKEVCRIYQKFLDVLYNQYPRLEEEPWPKNVESKWISPPTLYRLKATLINNVRHVQRIAKGVFKLIEKFFILSMLMLEAADAFSSSSAKGEEASVEVVSNIKKLKTQFNDNTELLLEKLKQNRALIEQLLNLCSVKQTEEDNQSDIDTLINWIEALLKKPNVISEGLTDVDKAGTDLIARTGKDLLFSAANVLGVTDYLPDSLIPPAPNSTSSPEQIFDRYIPDKFITRLDAKPKKHKPDKKVVPPQQKPSKEEIKILNKII